MASTPPPRPWRIALADDADGFRSRLAAAFEASPGWTCVGEFACPQAALDRLPSARPDLLLLDVHFRGAIRGDSMIADLKSAIPGLLIVMLTVAERSEVVFQSLRLGAVGYLLKGLPWEELRDQCEDALRGGSPMTPIIARKLIDEFARIGPVPQNTSNLSAAETLVLDHCARGETEMEIAAVLGKSRFTVRAQFRSILNKLNAATRAQAVAEAARRGWLSP